ncbi:hypothetical protein INS49_008154 [Diaporthe citri]|uniref:uncharacterized protein n=1 Tax=Diaporthe citri TaxID=83186 RepID=UPI001C81B896|nr:uncharacterized protein INS49_008154 [Diaporthe citri]KAG6363059.1 hypothetical protein INS49_008154 [Diaporthe citri]
MAKPKNGRPRYNPRPLCATVFLMTLLATYSIFLKDWSSDSTTPASLFARDTEEVCDDVHQAQDQCAFVRANCLDEEPGLFSYLTFYFCTLAKVKPIAFALLALWLGLLFSTIGIAASDFFSINLSTIASVLGLPESLAGVTFLAFGNGSPDVFSTFAAMNSNSGSMAIGELIGAAGFITAVVAGSMALVREFKVSRKTFVRDIVFFILSVSFTMVFLTDGKMHLWECAFMIAFYAFYVCFVFGWHLFSSRRQKWRTKQAMAHNHYSGASVHAGDEIEPYHDDPGDDDDDERVGSRRASSHLPDISALENGPRINSDGSSRDDDDDEQKRHIASEMTSSMRVNLATLPVVETEDHCDDLPAEDGLQSSQIPSGLGLNPPAIAVENQTAIQPETEWQEYRRRARSTRSRSSSASRYALSVGITPELENHQEFPDLRPPPSPQTGQPMSVSGLGSEPTTLDDESGGWNRWLLALQLFTGPLFTVFIIWAKYMDSPVKTLVKMILYSLLISLILLAILLLSTTPDTKPRYHFLFCFLGFIIAIAWISTIAEEVVGVLKAVGVILGISEAILGLTVFAVGNSVGDLVADITVARLGYPVMALSACFGGPMLNILLGIGLGGTYMSIKGAKHHHKKHPDEPLHYKSYHIEVTGTLFISAITVLLTLVMLLILVPTNKWMMTRKIGITLITLWTVSTIVNVIVEVTGVWSAVA